MTPEEAQQAETVKRIGEMLNTPWGHDVGQWVANCEDLREIVDSKTQKIDAMQKDKLHESLLGELADRNQEIKELHLKIAELKKSIASLYAHIDEMEAVK